jgi:sec-independent protein translocase protein TatC
VFLGAFLLGMVLTPPDVFSQTLLAVPMYALFELALLFCRRFLPER